MSPSPREPLPRFVEPMLATRGHVPEGPGWAAEVRWDGLRGQVRHDGRRTTLRSRNGHDLSGAFPELVDEARRRLGRRAALLDAEIVCLNSEGRPDFSAVRARMRSAAVPGGARRRTRLVVFDVLHVGGRSTRGLPYTARRAALDELEVHGGRWIVPAHFPHQVDDLVAVTREHGLEGVVLKRLNAPYLAGQRSAAWIKHKHRRQQNAVVLGCRMGDGRRPDAFILGREDGTGKIRYAGDASFGLTADERERIRALVRRRSSLPQCRSRGGRRTRRARRAAAPCRHASARYLTAPPRDARRPVRSAPRAQWLLLRHATSQLADHRGRPPRRAAPITRKR